MIHNLAENNALVGQFVAELRSSEIQTDRMRFRRNLERIGEICAYEIAKHLALHTIGFRRQQSPYLSLQHIY